MTAVNRRPLVHLLLLLLLCMLGCGRKGTDSGLVGTWRGETGASTTLHVFGTNGAYQLQRESTDELAEGTFTRDGDLLTITYSQPYTGTTQYKIRWLDQGSAELTTVEVDLSTGTKVTAANRDSLPKLKLTRLSEQPNFSGDSGPEVTVGKGKGATDLSPDERCQSNLKILVNAALLYAERNEGLLPPTNWQSALFPYFNDMDALNCPSLRSKGQYGGYAFNEELLGKRVPRETQPMIFETKIVGDNIRGTPLSDMEERHGNQSFAAFSDGSIRPYP